MRAADVRLDWRRLVISPLTRSKASNAAVAALQLALDAWPDSLDDRRLLASILGRLGRWDEAIAHADAAETHSPGDTSLHAARILLRLQAGLIDDAAHIASDTIELVVDDNESAHVWLMALTRGGQKATSARAAARLDPSLFRNERVAAGVVQSLLGDDRFDAAIAAGERALQGGFDGAALRSQLGQAYLARGARDDRAVSALEHFEQGVLLAPDDVRLASLHGKCLLGVGRYVDAIAPLQHACELAPNLDHPRAMLARAYRHSGRYTEAAETLLKLVKVQPERSRWQRLAIAALSQAGRDDEAGSLYDAYLRKRADALPDSFADALSQLEEKIDGAPVPRARLDWAWSLREDSPAMDRTAWERAACWGYLVDHLLLEWLECREDKAEEAMAVLGDLDEAERFLEPIRSQNKGFLIATAHVGPMYAGLMALELLGIPSRWLASMPSVARASYASALISTADQTETQVAKQCLRALDAGLAVCLAIDGAPSPSAPRITFEGQEITYSSFAARTAHRLGMPSIFYVPRWKNGKVVPTLAMLPEPRRGEDVEDYALRWQSTYLSLLREQLSGSPENLRLSGGLWRHVRRADRSKNDFRAHQ
ncbi:tetratricopeptide repeat protein [Caballeronia glebae]|uniref:tetratricopeptide repeat protein n=1 Tax=Caballeronia glebae TaxID=1777143 RepID=UPI0038BD2896